MAADAPARAQPAVRLAHQPARRRAEAGKALCPAARPRGAARHRPAVSSALGRHRPPRAAEAQRKCRPARSSPSRSPSTSTGRRRATGRARPIAFVTSDDTGQTLTLTFFNAREDYLRQAAARGRDALRLRHRRGLRRHAADGASRPRGGRDRALPICRWSSRSIRSPKASRSAMCGARWTARWRACPTCRNGRTRPGSRASAFRLSPRRLRHLHRPAEPHDIAPESLAWTRLAYDELLAGQLALALVRAHMRRQAGRGIGQRRPSARARLEGAALCAHAFAAEGGRRHRRRPRPPATHVAAAARRRRLRQDGGGADCGRRGDRGRAAGRLHGADRNSRPPAPQDHRAARRSRRHPRRHSHRARARRRARRAFSTAWRSATSIC